MAAKIEGKSDNVSQATNRITTSLFVTFGIVVLLGIITILWSADRWRGEALLWMLGYLLTGVLVGFLFSLPRVMSGGQGAPPTGGVASAAGDSPLAGKQFSYQLGINTNLERVSDWLTSGIVALGLIELKQLGPNLAAMADMMVGVNAAQADRSLAVAIVLFSVTGGFLIGFLGTRLVVSPLIRVSDQAATGTMSAALDAVEIGQQEGVATADASGDVKRVAEEAKSIKLESVKDDPTAVARWSRAQLLTGEVNSAIEGFERAVKLTPQSARNRYEYAMSLLRAGKPRSEILNVLEEAAKLAKSDGDLDLREKIYNSLAYSWLYQPAPNGFQRAISATEEYLALSGSTPSGSILVNLACGYGQSAAWLKQYQPADEEAFQEAREKTLDAMKAAIQVRDDWKARFRELLNNPQGDNDLHVFVKDDVFQTLVRQ